MSINRNVFIHKSDKAAIQVLKSVPGFSQVLKTFMKLWDEKLQHIENMAGKVRISENQLPHYYNMLLPICEKLGIDTPEFYLELNPFANAYTHGNTNAAITITSGLLETLPDELIPTVIAHECGHIACHHVLYTTMGTMLRNKGIDLLYKLLPFRFANIALIPLYAAFFYWMRCSEYSADRAAVLCDGTPDKTIEVCMRLAGFDKDIAQDNPNLDAFFDQAREYRQEIKDSAYKKALEKYMFMYNDHPMLSVRALEAYEWSGSEDFIKAKQYFDAYKKDEKPKELPLSWNEKHFLGRNYEEVERELIDFGFYDIELIRSTEKARFTKENSVVNVDIKGTDKYKEGDWYSVDSIVEVKYYLPFTDEEIAAMHPGEIKLPDSPKRYVGKPYKEVDMILTELGFENITVKEVKDIEKEKDKNLGKVASIIIDNDPKLSKGEWVDESAVIVITYHQLQ